MQLYTNCEPLWWWEINQLLTNKLERGLTYSLHHELHRLDVSERIQFRVAATVYRCQHNMAPRHLSDMCKPITSLSRRQSLRSDSTSDLVIPRVRRATYGCRAFSVAGPCSLLELSTRLPQVTGSFIWPFQTSTQDISVLCILGRIVLL